VESRTDRRLPHTPSPYIRSESFSLNREYFGGGSRLSQIPHGADLVWRIVARIPFISDSRSANAWPAEPK